MILAAGREDPSLLSSGRLDDRRTIGPGVLIETGPAIALIFCTPVIRRYSRPVIVQSDAKSISRFLIGSGLTYVNGAEISRVKVVIDDG